MAELEHDTGGLEGQVPPDVVRADTERMDESTTAVMNENIEC